jgi:hypothetical protein
VALTTYVEMRDGERWQDVAGAFLVWCHRHKEVAAGGCHQGDPGGPADGRRYAAVSIPDHNPALAGLLREWAVSESRRIG